MDFSSHIIVRSMRAGTLVHGVPVMRRIALICAILIVLVVGGVGCLYIFDVMTFETAQTTVLEVGGAIVLLGICAAAIKALMK
jgi:hypothetical protein